MSIFLTPTLVMLIISQTKLGSFRLELLFNNTDNSILQYFKKTVFKHLII